MFAKENKGWDITAVAPEAVDISEPLYTMVNRDNIFSYDLNLKMVKSTKKGLIYSDDISLFNNPWLDILINDFAVPLFSENFKEFFDTGIKEEKYIKWIKIKIHGNNNTKTYYVPEFTKKLDVLNMEKCTLNEYDNSVIVPCCSYKKIQKYILFHVPDNEEYLWRVPYGVCISNETRKKIIENKFTGIDYEKIRTSE